MLQTHCCICNHADTRIDPCRSLVPSHACNDIPPPQFDSGQSLPGSMQSWYREGQYSLLIIGLDSPDPASQLPGEDLNFLAHVQTAVHKCACDNGSVTCQRENPVD